MLMIQRGLYPPAAAIGATVSGVLNIVSNIVSQIISALSMRGL
jgi:prophage DNA circulation protein